MDQAVKQFRKRNAILEYLQHSKAHPSAEAVYAALQQEHSDISLATVYRNLARFKEQGLILSLGTVNGVERFDGCTAPHIHFACRLCGCVADVPELDIPESISGSTAESLGCRVESAQLMLTGICRDCLQNNQVN